MHHVLTVDDTCVLALQRCEIGSHGSQIVRDFTKTRTQR